ncbi:hypothetical protein WR25_08432 [Diploscapter pachys]|uniref:Major sperm protein n=1 Tax=Diploscapter pachys TaxID=2018661 RepID=A0A2A2KTM8_9BILA|nr:hypothetical protein WR25_08432 [Diploscapter pachys]
MQQPAPQWIALDRILLCFDVEQANEASQAVCIRRCTKHAIAWRVLTNSPTQFIVSPNRGILSDDLHKEIRITLVKNIFLSENGIRIEAMPIKDKTVSLDKIWENPLPANRQQLQFELTTTLVNIAKATALGASARQLSTAEPTVEEMLLSSNHTAKELNAMEMVLKQDIEIIEKNIRVTTQLQNRLQTQLKTRQEQAEQLRLQLEGLEADIAVLKRKVDTLMESIPKDQRRGQMTYEVITSPELGGQGEAISFLLVSELRPLTAFAKQSDNSVPIDPPDNKEIKEGLLTKTPKTPGKSKSLENVKKPGKAQSNQQQKLGGGGNSDANAPCCIS